MEQKICIKLHFFSRSDKWIAEPNRAHHQPLHTNILVELHTINHWNQSKSAKLCIVSFSHEVRQHFQVAFYIITTFRLSSNRYIQTLTFQPYRKMGTAMGNWIVVCLSWEHVYTISQDQKKKHTHKITRQSYTTIDRQWERKSALGFSCMYLWYLELVGILFFIGIS